jgi:putative hydrolases of HD superfamily
MSSNHLLAQIHFLLEIDKLKEILRQSYLTRSGRRENSAEHSWHVALMAVILAEHANVAVDVLKVVKMLLIHDIVEIDAGDAYIYDDAAQHAKAAREQEAATRLFGLLPPTQAQELRELWQEYEQRLSPEARFGAALDRLMPMLHNYHTQGRSWQEHGIHSSQVYARNAHIAEGSQTLWQYARTLIEEAVQKNYLSE